MHRDFTGLQYIVDKHLIKQAEGVLGEAKTPLGAVGRTALYATPILGSGLSIADGIQNFRNGQILRGLGNVGLGVLSGAADLLSAGTLGTAIRGGALAARVGRMAKATKGIIGAKNAARLTNGARAVQNSRALNSTLNTAGKAGRTIQRGFGRFNRNIVSSRPYRQYISPYKRKLRKSWLGRRVIDGAHMVGGMAGLDTARTFGGRMLMRGAFGEGGLLGSAPEVLENYYDIY